MNTESIPEVLDERTAAQVGFTDGYWCARDFPGIGVSMPWRVGYSWKLRVKKNAAFEATPVESRVFTAYMDAHMRGQDAFIQQWSMTQVAEALAAYAEVEA